MLANDDLAKPSNLNRQQYFVDQTGMFKTTALRENFQYIHSYVQIDIIEKKLTEGRFPAIFKG